MPDPKFERALKKFNYFNDQGLTKKKIGGKKENQNSKPKLSTSITENISKEVMSTKSEKIENSKMFLIESLQSHLKKFESDIRIVQKYVRHNREGSEQWKVVFYLCDPSPLALYDACDHPTAAGVIISIL